MWTMLSKKANTKLSIYAHLYVKYMDWSKSEKKYAKLTMIVSFYTLVFCLKFSQAQVL